MKFFTVLYMSFCMLLTGCSKTIGYGVVNWSMPEHNLSAADMLPVLVRSNISKMYIVELNNKKIEIPLWQLTFCTSRKEAQQYIQKISAYRSIYASVNSDGLPLRDEPKSTGKQLYRLRKKQILKVLWKGQGEPVIARDKPLEGDWLYVMTNDGSKGWCFSYHLYLYDEKASGTLQTAVETAVDEMLQSIVTSRWHPDYYRDMIARKHIDPERMSKAFGFFPGADTGVVRIVLPEQELSFPYTAIKKNRMGAYLFEDSPVVMQIRNEDTIGVHIADEKGQVQAYQFITLKENPVELVQREKQHRAALLRQFITKGPNFNSGNYGILHFLEGNRFRWSGYKVLSPSIIPKGTAESGSIAIRHFISSKLKTEYQGIISFRFDGSKTWIDFFYTLSAQGLKLEYVKPENIKEGAAVARNVNPVILFFGSEGSS